MACILSGFRYNTHVFIFSLFSLWNVSILLSKALQSLRPILLDRTSRLYISEGLVRYLSSVLMEWHIHSLPFLSVHIFLSLVLVSTRLVLPRQIWSDSYNLSTLWNALNTRMIHFPSTWLTSSASRSRKKLLRLLKKPTALLLVWTTTK